MAEQDARRETLMQLYRSFNARDIDGVLAHLAPGVDWPNGWEGGREHGREAVRSYWTRQWAAIEPLLANDPNALLAPVSISGELLTNWPAFVALLVLAHAP